MREKKNVIVVMLDTLQFNYLGCYGNKVVKTPEGVVFENAYTEGLPTVPCRRAMLTGRYTLPVKGWSQLDVSDTTIADLCWGQPIDSYLIHDSGPFRLPKFGYSRGFDKVFFLHGHETDHQYYAQDELGGGIGGMTAALYAARANLSVRIVEKEVCGGLVNWTHTVENVPSYKSIHGMDLMTACREHVESLGVAIEEVNEVEEVRLDGQPKEIRTSEGDSFTADVVIIATGRKPIPLPVETAFEKVHYCSVCDGTAYKDKDVLVVGGGNSGFDESLYLAGLGVRSVHIVEMFPACAAAQSTQDRALATSIIRANVNTTITALDPLPDGRCRASLRDAASGAASEETVDGVFCFIGQKPNTALFEGLIDMEKGYIRTDEDMRTSLPGVFAVGDVRAKRYRQITTAMGDGTVAALEAERFIRSLR